MYLPYHAGVAKYMLWQIIVHTVFTAINTCVMHSKLALSQRDCIVDSNSPT